MKPTFFKDQKEFRDWLRRNHKKELVLWVGYYKKATGLPSMTWSESVDQALCYGWIDGLRRSIDERSYKIRFTPRKPTSNWSDVNIKKVAELKKKKLMRAAGLAAYKRREEKRSRAYTYEQAAVDFAKSYESIFKKNRKAWSYFSATTPSYRKNARGWVMSAIKEETRRSRLALLIKHSEKGERIPQMRRGT